MMMCERDERRKDFDTAAMSLGIRLIVLGLSSLDGELSMLPINDNRQLLTG